MPRYGLAAVYAALVLLAGCGSGDDTGAPALTTPTTATTSTTATVAVDVVAPSSTAPPAGGATATSVARSSSPTPTEPSEAAPAPTGDDLHTLAPPGGRYEYDTTGYGQSGTGPTSRRSDMPPVTFDDVGGEAGGAVTVRTTFDEGAMHEATYLVSPTELRLSRLAFVSVTNGVRTEQVVAPDPPFGVARAPYRAGDRWEDAWQDAALGIKGVGTGEVLRAERVHVRAGAFDTYVVRVDHRIRGSVTGRLQATWWIDPATGRRVRDETVVDLDMAGSPSHTEWARVLR